MTADNKKAYAFDDFIIVEKKDEGCPRAIIYYKGKLVEGVSIIYASQSYARYINQKFGIYPEEDYNQSEVLNKKTLDYLAEEITKNHKVLSKNYDGYLELKSAKYNKLSREHSRDVCRFVKSMEIRFYQELNNLNEKYLNKSVRENLRNQVLNELNQQVKS